MIKKEKTNIFDINNDYICDKAKYRLEIAEVLTAEKQTEKIELLITQQNKDRLIRRCLEKGICPDCGGNIRYRMSYDFRTWILCWFDNMRAQICICKDCGAKKGLLNWKY